MARKKRNRKGIKRYPTDLSQQRWEIIKDLLPAAAPGGRPRTINLRKLLNVTRGGIAWRLLPLDSQSWQKVYGYFLRWTENGTWTRIHDALRDRTRRKAGRKEHPTAACLDSQSVKTKALAGEKGFDAGKKIQGRKRHLLVDTLGLVLAVVVTAASVQDRDSAKLVFQALSDKLQALASGLGRWRLSRQVAGLGAGAV